jgi:hypothetical protein
MGDPIGLIVLSSAALFGTAMAAAAMLKGWQGWLEVKRLELSGPSALRPGGGTMGRIELADLRERVRKLEAIANGTEL